MREGACAIPEFRGVSTGTGTVVERESPARPVRHRRSERRRGSAGASYQLPPGFHRHVEGLRDPSIQHGSEGDEAP